MGPAAILATAFGAFVVNFIAASTTAFIGIGGLPTQTEPIALTLAVITGLGEFHLPPYIYSQLIRPAARIPEAWELCLLYQLAASVLVGCIVTVLWNMTLRDDGTHRRFSTVLEIHPGCGRWCNTWRKRRPY